MVNINEQYLYAYLNREKPEFNKTIEALTSQRAYNSLREEEKLEYAIYSTSLDPIFFVINLKEIEEKLPSYPNIVKKYIRKILSREEIERLEKNPKTIKKYLAKHLPEEWIRIQEEYSKQLWYNFRKLLIPTYAFGIFSTYFATNNVYSILYWIAGVMPYYGIKILAYKIKDRRIAKYLNNVANIYFFGKYGISGIFSSIEFGIIAPLIGNFVERVWPYLPKNVRRFIDKSEKWLSGIKIKKFDEKELRELLSNVPKKVQHQIPKNAVNKFLEELENGLIEIENPRETLIEAFVLSYHRRKIVIDEKGQIVDKEFIKKLSRIEGTFVKKMENKLLKRPWKYLGIDLKNGKIVWVRDIIGLLPTKNEGLFNGLIRKEGYACLLGKKADLVMQI